MNGEKNAHQARMIGNSEFQSFIWDLRRYPRSRSRTLTTSVPTTWRWPALWVSKDYGSTSQAHAHAVSKTETHSLQAAFSNPLQLICHQSSCLLMFKKRLQRTSLTRLSKDPGFSSTSLERHTPRYCPLSQEDLCSATHTCTSISSLKSIF